MWIPHILQHVGAGRDGGRGWSAVHPTHERYSQTNSGPATISCNDGVTRQCGKPWKHTAQARWIKQLRVQSAASFIPLCSIHVYKVLEGVTLDRQYSNYLGVKRNVARMLYERYDRNTLRP